MSYKEQTYSKHTCLLPLVIISSSVWCYLHSSYRDQTLVRRLREWLKWDWQKFAIHPDLIWLFLPVLIPLSENRPHRDVNLGHEIIGPLANPESTKGVYLYLIPLFPSLFLLCKYLSPSISHPQAPLSLLPDFQHESSFILCPLVSLHKWSSDSLMGKRRKKRLFVILSEGVLWTKQSKHSCYRKLFSLQSPFCMLLY